MKERKLIKSQGHWSDVISNLRIPLAICVVFIHFDINNENFLFYRDMVGKPEWVKLVVVFFSGVLPSVAVPLFFFFSGFLLFNGKDFCLKVYQQVLRSRIRTLLVPFFLWNLVAIVKEIVSNYTHPDNLRLSFCNFAMSFFDHFHNEGIVESNMIGTEFYPIDVPLWFVRDLMVAVVSTPIIHWMVQKFGVLGLSCLGLLWSSTGSFMISCGWPSQLLTAFFFFAWGAFYGINRIDFVKIFRKVWFAPVVYVVLLIINLFASNLEFHSFLHHLMVLFGILTIVNMVSNFKRCNRKWLRLSASSFFVFALHFLIRGQVGLLLEPLVSDNVITLIVFYILTPFTITLICIVVYIFLKRYIPQLCYLLSGGR